MTTSGWLARVLAALLVMSPWSSAQIGGLRLRINQGEGVINSTSKPVKQVLSVTVSDQADNPVQNATVTFTAPSFGAGGSFGAGEKTAVSMTDERGLAQSPAFETNSVEGRYVVRATASFQGRQVTAMIPQVNSAAGGVGANGGSAKKWLLLLGLAGGGAAGALALRGGSPGTSATAAPTRVSVNGVVVGAP